MKRPEHKSAQPSRTLIAHARHKHISIRDRAQQAPASLLAHLISKEIRHPRPRPLCPLLPVPVLAALEPPDLLAVLARRGLDEPPGPVLLAPLLHGPPPLPLRLL